MQVPISVYVPTKSNDFEFLGCGPSRNYFVLTGRSRSRYKVSCPFNDAIEGHKCSQMNNWPWPRSSMCRNADISL